MKRVLIATTVAALGLIAGACADDYPRRVVYVAGPGPGWERHVDWCLNHHPGYDPRSNQFIGLDGYPHVCR